MNQPSVSPGLAMLGYLWLKPFPKLLLYRLRSLSQSGRATPNIKGNTRQYRREGDWVGYGRELDALKTVLDQLAELTAEE